MVKYEEEIRKIHGERREIADQHNALKERDLELREKLRSLQHERDEVLEEQRQQKRG